MVGIVGFLTRLPREYAEDKLSQMLEALRQRDSYVAHMWVEESIGLYIGWVTRTGSACHESPLRNERGDVVLFFSGEEFSDPGTEAGRKQRRQKLNGSGPAHLVHLYEEDPRFPAGLNGRFHGVLINRDRQTAFLFNDRYAMHRIYYHQANDGFYFAAEAKSILAVCPETRSIDLRGAGEFVACNCTLEWRTLFEGISVLPGSAKWSFANGSVVKKEFYFEAKEWENQETLTPESYYREFRDVFSRSLPRYFQGSESIGMSLTGGLDTRMIMAWQKCSPGSLPCYTFGGEFRDCRDVILGRQVARTCGQVHEVIPVGKEFFADFPYYAERSVLLTDGSVDVGRAPDLYLNQAARAIARVRMSGVYGGEVLRGVRAFKPEETRSDLFTPEFHGYIQRAKETYGRNLKGHPVSFAVFKQTPWYNYGILALEQTQVSVRTPFLDNDLVRTVFRAPESSLSSNETCIRLIAEGNSALLGIPTDRGVYLNRRGLFGTASHGLLEFLFKAEYAYDVGMPQWLTRLDHAFSRFHLQRLFLGRHKVFHFRVWYRDALANYVQETLLDSRSLSRPYLNRRVLQGMVRGHLNGNRNYTLEIHKVLTLELVQRLLVNEPATSNSREFRTSPLTVNASSGSESPRGR